MKKTQYLSKLKVKLIRSGLRKSEIDGALQYYDELIDEAVDRGESESSVIARLPSPQVVADEIKNGGNDEPFIAGDSPSRPPNSDYANYNPNYNSGYNSGYNPNYNSDYKAEYNCENKAGVGNENRSGYNNENRSGYNNENRSGYNNENATNYNVKYDSNPEYNRPQGQNSKNSQNTPAKTAKKMDVTTRIILLVVFAIFVFPVIIGIVSTLFGIFVALFATALSLIVCGVAIPIYAVIVAIMSHSLMVLFAYLAGGLLCLAIGLFLSRLIRPLLMCVIACIKWIVKTIVSFVKGE